MAKPLRRFDWLQFITVSLASVVAMSRLVVEGMHRHSWIEAAIGAIVGYLILPGLAYSYIQYRRRCDSVE